MPFMNTTLAMPEGVCRTLSERESTTIGHGNYDRAWAVSACGCDWQTGVADAAGIVVDDDRIAANPINRRDPSGLRSIQYSGKFSTEHATFFPWIGANRGQFTGMIQSSGRGFCSVVINFKPNDDLGRPEDDRCQKIGLIQVIVDEKWQMFGIPGLRSFEKQNTLDSDPGDPIDESLYPLYPGTQTYWEKGDMNATMQDRPGATPSAVGIAYMFHRFRVYAVALEGKERGYSYGYIEWGDEWAYNWLTGSYTQNIWLGNMSLPSGRRPKTMNKTIGSSGLLYVAPRQDPIPGGVIISDSTSWGNVMFDDDTSVNYAELIK